MLVGDTGIETVSPGHSGQCRFVLKTGVSSGYSSQCRVPWVDGNGLTCTLILHVSCTALHGERRN